MKLAAKLLVVAAFAAYLVWEGATASPYSLDILAIGLVFGIYAAGVDLSWGFGGILLLGSALYFGIGAYTTAFALQRGWEPLLAYPVGISAAVVIGLAIAVVGFRVGASQVHFGLMVLAISLLFQHLALNSYSLTGGSNGLIVATRPKLAGVLDLSQSPRYYVFVASVGALVVGGAWVLLRSAWGEAVRAVRTDEIKAEALGYRVLAVKLQVTAVAAAVIALAGTLYTPLAGSAYPDLFAITLSMQALVWVALGGAGSLFGPALAAIVLTKLQNDLSSSLVDYYQLILGALFVVVVLAAPAGIAGLRVPRRLRGRARGRQHRTELDETSRHVDRVQTDTSQMPTSDVGQMP